MIIVIRDKKLNYKKHSGLFMRWKGLRKIPQPLEKTENPAEAERMELISIDTRGNFHLCMIMGEGD